MHNHPKAFAARQEAPVASADLAVPVVLAAIAKTASSSSSSIATRMVGSIKRNASKPVSLPKRNLANVVGLVLREVVAVGVIALPLSQARV